MLSNCAADRQQPTVDADSPSPAPLRCASSCLINNHVKYSSVSMSMQTVLHFTVEFYKVKRAGKPFIQHYTTYACKIKINKNVLFNKTGKNDVIVHVAQTF